MAEKKQSSFEKVGYIKQLPPNADIIDYESILVKNMNAVVQTWFKLI